MKNSIIIILAAYLFSIIAFAREYSDIQCENDTCKFKDQIGEGPTMTRDWETGYCNKCKKFVYRNWDRTTGEPPENFTVWDPESGKTRTLFACPQCKQLVFVIKKKSEIKYCPKCNSDKIKISEPHTFKD